jgi:hypothetical protein
MLLPIAFPFLYNTTNYYAPQYDRTLTLERCRPRDRMARLDKGLKLQQVETSRSFKMAISEGIAMRIASLIFCCSITTK